MKFIAKIFVVLGFVLEMLYAPIACAQSLHPSSSIYQELGGKEGVAKIVSEFVTIVLADERINKAFKDVDIPHLRAMLEEQFCSISGGSCKYTGKDMKTIHEDLGITNAQFNALAEDLQTTMEKNGIPSSVQNKLIARLAPMQRDIVTK